MSEKLYPCLQQDQNLDLRLKEINSFLIVQFKI